MRMLKTLGATAVASGLLIAGAVAPASAAPGGGCPTGDNWNLVIAEFFVIPEIDNGNFADQNGDGLVCFRVALGGAKKDGGYVFKDNTNKLVEPPPPVG